MIFVVLFCLLERRRKVVFVRKFSLYVQFTSFGRNSELLTYKVLVWVGILSQRVLLKFVSQTVMLEPSSSKRCYVVTGSTPHKPVEKRSREGNSHARKPLDFSVKNSSASVDSLTSPSYKVIFCCYINVVCPFLFVFFSVFGW